MTEQNFFDFYELVESFTIDAKALKKKYLLLSKKYHPDFFTLSSGAEQERILELSTLNNNAYNTLKDQQKRTEYILTLNGLLGKEKEEPIPQEFLMEMMDINEQLMELQFDPNPEALKLTIEEINRIEAKIREEIEALKQQYDVNNSLKSILESIKKQYLKSKYVIRLKEKLKNF